MSDKFPLLRARIERTPDGLFKAVYSATGSGPPGGPSMPDSHIATTEAELRTWVEQMAKWSGFSRVEWEGSGPEEGPPAMY